MASDAPAGVRVQVCHALRDSVWRRDLELAPGATAAQALAASGFARQFPDLDAWALGVGVYGRLAAPGTVLVDGTLWTADEMIRLGFSEKMSWDMGHLPLSGPGGMIELLEGIGPRRKILIHINNTNPILDENSSERALLTRHGIEVAYDGMEITL